ncbi:MAG: hypothetical protein ABSD96_10565 [Candidatus Korobacteraceae bacterium]
MHLAPNRLYIFEEPISYITNFLTLQTHRPQLLQAVPELLYTGGLIVALKKQDRMF